MKLWELINEYNAIANDEDLDEDSLIGMLEIIKGDIEEKTDNVVKMALNYEAEAEKFAKVAQQFVDRQRMYARKAKRLREYVYNSMNAAGLTEVKNDIFKIKIQKNGGVAPLIIHEGVEIPKEFQKVHIDIDTEKVRETLKTQQLDFAELGERGTHLVIK